MRMRKESTHGEAIQREIKRLQQADQAPFSKYQASQQELRANVPKVPPVSDMNGSVNMHTLSNMSIPDKDRSNERNILP